MLTWGISLLIYRATTHVKARPSIFCMNHLTLGEKWSKWIFAHLMTTSSSQEVASPWRELSDDAMCYLEMRLKPTNCLLTIVRPKLLPQLCVSSTLPPQSWCMSHYHNLSSIAQSPSPCASTSLGQHDQLLLLMYICLSVFANVSHHF